MKNNLELSGKKFTRLLVLRKHDISKHLKVRWLCLCDCGKYTIVVGSHLLNGNTKSCNCIQKEKVGALNRTHNKTKSDEYQSWANIKSRCTNPKASHYERYGGRGVIMCERWLNSFENFFEDMGKRPSKEHSIDRINNDGNYELDNCRWATNSQQSRNKSPNVYLEYAGISMVQSDWAKRWNITATLIKQHIKSGKSFEQIFNHFENNNNVKRRYQSFMGHSRTIADWAKIFGIHKCTFNCRFNKIGNIEKTIEYFIAKGMILDYRMKLKLVESKLKK